LPPKAHPSDGERRAGDIHVTVPPLGIEDGDFERIKEAVRETARGRWFLDEFARRVRADDTARFLIAVERLEEQAATRSVADAEGRRQRQRILSLLSAIVDHLDPRVAHLSEALPVEPGRGADAACDMRAQLDRSSVPGDLEFAR
jgi:hypothetical protein